MNDLTHEQCSGLLRGFASGGLDAGDYGRVSDHLTGCEECSLELAGLQALIAAEVVPLSGLERDELARSVRTRVTTAPKPSFSERFGRRFAPALGAVAFLALGAVALVSLQDERQQPAAGGDTSNAEVADRDTGAPAPEAAQKAQLKSGTGDVAGITAEDSGAGAGGSADAAETTTSAGTTMQMGSPFEAPGAFAITGISVRALFPERALRRGVMAYNSSLDRLTRSAPDKQVAEQIRDCTARTVAESPHPLVPSAAVYYDDGVLVIGFVWLEGSTQILNYEIRGWLGGDCGRISPIYRRGVLE